MANPPAVNRRQATADLVPPFFKVYLAAPAGTGWLAERVGEFWEPVSLIEADGGEFSTLTLRLELGSEPDLLLALQGRPEDVGSLQSGTRVRLVDEGQDPPREWFRGYIGQGSTLIQASPDAEQFTITAYGPEWLLAGKVVTGQWHTANRYFSIMLAGNATFVPFQHVVELDLPAVFNDGGPNMSPWNASLAWWIDDDSDGYYARTFVDTNWIGIRNGVEIGRAQTWTAYQALYATLLWYGGFDLFTAAIGELENIEATLKGITIGEVSIDGLPLTDAIRAILGPIGYGFRITPDADRDGEHSLHVYPLKSQLTGKTPYLPPIDSEATDAQGSRGELSRIDFLRDSHNIRNETEVCGSRKMVQLELGFNGAMNQNLFPAWSTDSYPITSWLSTGVFAVAQVTNPQALEDKHHSKGKDYATHRDIYRTFIFNEDGGGLDYAWYGDDAMPEIGAYGLGEALIRRPIGPTLIRSGQTNDFLKPIIKMFTTTGGETFVVDVTEYFEVLKDRAGIHLKDTKDWFQTAATSTEGVWDWKPFSVLTSDGKDSANKAAVKNLSYLTLLNNSISQAGDLEMVLTVTGTMESTECVKATAGRLGTSPMALTRGYERCR